MKRKIIIRHWSMKHPNQYIGRPRAFKHTKLLISFGIMMSLAVVQGVDYKVTHPVFVSPLQQVSADYTTHSVKLSPTPIPSPIPAPGPEKEANIKIIQWVFGKDADTAIRVFSCESGLRTTVVSPVNTDGLYDVGIAQIHVFPSDPFTIKDMQNPIANVLEAKRKFDASGWQPWYSSNACHHALDNN